MIQKLVIFHTLKNKLTLIASLTAAATASWTLEVVVEPEVVTTAPAEVITTVVPGTASIMSSSLSSVTSYPDCNV